MKILSASQIKEADQYTIKQEPIPSINLMERAARQLTDALLNYYPGEAFHIFLWYGQ